MYAIAYVQISVLTYVYMNVCVSVYSTRLRMLSVFSFSNLLILLFFPLSFLYLSVSL